MLEIFIPFIVLIYYSFYLLKNNYKNILPGLIFVSFFVFSTNYENFGLGFDVYRYLHRIIGISLVIALIFHIVIHRVNVFEELTPKLILLFFCVLILSFIGNNVNTDLYLHYLRNFIFIGAIVLYLFYVVDDDEKLQNLFNLIISITIILSFFVIFEVFQNGWGYRVGLFYSNPNYLGYSFIPGLAFTGFHRNRYIGWIFLPIIIFAIFATGSRAAELSSIFILIVYLFQIDFKRLYLLIFVSLIFVLILIFFDSIVFNMNFNNSRYMIAKIALNIFHAEPINGMGYGQFRINFHQYVDQEIMGMNNNDINDMLRAYKTEYGYSASVGHLANLQPGQTTPSFHYENRSLEKMTHNDFISIAVELGTFGILFLIYFFYKLYLELKKLLITNKNYYYLSLGLIGGSLIFSFFHNNLTSFVFWFILFIPFIINRNQARIT
jgi:hypothetical protein